MCKGKTFGPTRPSPQRPTSKFDRIDRSVVNDINVRPNLCEVIPPLPRLIRPSINCTNHCAPRSSTYVRRIVNEGQKRRWEWLPPAQVKLTRCECLPSEVLLLINLRLIGRGDTCNSSYVAYRNIAVMPSGTAKLR